MGRWSLSLWLVPLIFIFCTRVPLVIAIVSCSYPGTASEVQQRVCTGMFEWPYDCYIRIKECKCKPGYSGTTCTTRACSAEEDCNSRGTTYGNAPCTCTNCVLPYTGNNCEREICHKDFHCSNRGANISGTIYPDCVCTCTTPQYVGNSCQGRCL